jgi:hypothetical protein
MTELEREFFTDKEEFDSLAIDMAILRMEIAKLVQELKEDN